MHAAGLIIPKMTELCLYIAETYEALTFLFFLRLVLTYLGGKKSTKATLKGDHVHVNVFPLCCLVCFPSFKFTRKYFIFCEWLIYSYVIFSVVFGFIEMANILDQSHDYPANVVEADISLAYNITSLALLVVAIYGLSGIYHSAEEYLKHRAIIKKFLVYKVFVTLAKIEELLVGSLVSKEIIHEEWRFNNVFTAALRARFMVSFLIVVEAAFFFPLACRWYGTEDYVALEEEGNLAKDIDVVIDGLAEMDKNGLAEMDKNGGSQTPEGDNKV
eukprot:sb/3468110/